MTMTPIELGPANTDDDVDDIIRTCLNPAAPRSFFVYAGAGSGKTRSLKRALEGFRAQYGDAYRRAGSRIAVITYTRAAAQEITDRLGEDPLFPVSTIHSFCWTLIGPHQTDIRVWLLKTLPVTLAEIVEKQAKGRAGQASIDRDRAMKAIERRLEYLSVPRTFTYNPNGDNFGADSLSHAEVLAIAAAFITTKPAMQAVVVNSYPFLLIDESQDTTNGLIAALFYLAEVQGARFALGLLGDTMQRIYGDGQADLGTVVPDGWASPVKRMNHRSGRRIVQLGNAIRAGADGQTQFARDDSIEGVVRFFVARSDTSDKPALERRIHARMRTVCADDGWDGPAEDVKTLTLEHHMAASRRGFASMFSALDVDKSLSTGLRQGSLPGLRLFSERVAPLFAASDAGEDFAIMNLLREASPLVKTKALAESENSADPLRAPRAAVTALLKLRRSNPDMTFLDILQCVAEHSLFEIPASLAPFLERDAPATETDDVAQAEDEAVEEGADSESPVIKGLEAWRAFLSQPYRQIVPFVEYVADQGPYGTHQGVKGLEFERVLVIMDDTDAKGFLFSYEKLFGTKPLSGTDLKRAAAGEETGADRTRRLLYVTATRAEKSLALVGYTDDPAVLAISVVKNGWFSADEVEVIV
jgi:DNA helicase-2/ATP-dependent DNA helicase PcrA